MKKRLLLSLTVAAIMGSSITVWAAPQYMADGAIFDPEYYLEQNPDVAASQGLGTSADSLYQHYTRYGAGEGRAPYDASRLDLTNILPYQGTDTTAVPQQAETTPLPVPGTSSQLPVILMRDRIQLTDEKTIVAVEGESYPLAWQTGARYNRNVREKDDLIGVTFQYISQDSMDATVKERLAPYTLPGYEWRQVTATFAFDPQLRDLLANPDLYVDGSFNWDSSQTAIRGLGSPWGFHQNAGFAVNHNGVAYSECAFCASDNMVVSR